MKSIQKSRVIGRVIVLAVALCMLFAIAIPANATEDKVREAADGVLFFSMNIDGQSYGRGSSFLINEDTIITSNHCVHFSKAEYDWYYKKYGLKQEFIDKKLTYEVTISRDFTIPAKLVNSSENMDFAILKLSQPINKRKTLPLRNSTEVQAAEAAYSVGFPAVKDSEAKTAQYYNQKDMIFESGTINRTQYTDRFRMGNEGFDFVGDVLMITASTMSGGNSGGPLVDADGNVIGICMAGNSGSCYASAISQVIEVLDTIGVKYTKAGVPDPVPDPVKIDYSELEASIAKAEAKKDEKDNYTSESYQNLSDKLVSAKAALSAEKQEDVDSAKNDLDEAINGLVEAPKTNYTLIITIAVVAFVIIAVGVVLAIVLTGRKKDDKTDDFAAVPNQPVFANVPPAPQQIPVNVGTTVAPADSGETTVLSGDGGETTILSSDGGETTVLTKQVNGGKLIRVSNNENIPITYSGFTIGKKRREVDYCIGDNTNISRNHAKFIVRDDVTYIVDNKSTNGTFVNNSTVRPGEEVALNDGDTIMLADEKFEFKK